MEKTLEKQKASFVSLPTKKLRRKPLGHLTFLHVLFLEKEGKTNKTKNTQECNFSYQLVSSHAKRYTYLSKKEKKKKRSKIRHRLDMPLVLL